MKILILSDIHANIEALEAIKETYDGLLCLGDLVDYGPSPRECLEFIRQRAYTTVRGNHDHAVGFREDCRCSISYRDLSVATRELMWQILREEELSYLRFLPTYQIVSLGGARFYLVHATPSDPLFTYLPPSTDEKTWIKEIAGIDTDVILLGHTHLPMIKKIGGKTIVNPGSVGQPKGGINQASYAIWDDGHIELKSVPYDYRKTGQKIEQTALDRSIKFRLQYLLEHGTLPEM